MERKARRARRARPGAEPLETRQLLNARFEAPNGNEINDKDLRRLAVQRRNNVPLDQRAISYTTNEGARVAIRLFGVGTLAGTTVRPDGALALVYDGTNEESTIRARVSGRTAGDLPLASIRDASLPIDDLSGVGGNIVRRVDLDQFGLVRGGRINLTAGVGVINLASVAPDSQVHLREIPGFNATPRPTTGGTATGVSGLVVTQTVSGSSAVIDTGGSGTTTTPDFAIPDTEPAPTSTPTSTSGNTFTQQGRTYTYATQPNGGRVLVSVTGTFVPSANLVGTLERGQAGPPPAPTGSIIDIDRIEGPESGARLGPSQIVGYDPAAGLLVRFDGNSGAVLGTARISVVPPAGQAQAPASDIGLAEAGDREVVLVGSGTSVQAFDPITGAPAGDFNVGGPSWGAFDSVDGIGVQGNRAILVDADAGLARVVDVTASLLAPSNQAVPLTTTFAAGRGLVLPGGAAGVPGRRPFYATGSANFDTFTNDLEPGVVALTTAAGAIAETARVALPNLPTTGAPPSGPLRAVGSFDADLGIGFPNPDGTTTVRLYNPQSQAPTGSVTLQYTGLLSGLSESFHPELADAALIDMQGNVQLFRARTARGFVFNDNGNLNLVDIDQAADSVIVGLPVGHVDIDRRSNVNIFSSRRSVGMRGEVNVVVGRRPIGPLVLP